MEKDGVRGAAESTLHAMSSAAGLSPTREEAMGWYQIELPNFPQAGMPPFCLGPGRFPTSWPELCVSHCGAWSHF